MAVGGKDNGSRGGEEPTRGRLARRRGSSTSNEGVFGTIVPAGFRLRLVNTVYELATPEQRAAMEAGHKLRVGRGRYEQALVITALAVINNTNVAGGVILFEQLSKAGETDKGARKLLAGIRRTAEDIVQAE